MTNYAVADRLFTVDEYIAFEEKSEIRHEFHEGILYPIDGTSFDHNEIIQNVVVSMYSVFRKRGCKIANENVKVQAIENSKSNTWATTRCSARTPTHRSATT